MTCGDGGLGQAGALGALTKVDKTRHRAAGGGSRFATAIEAVRRALGLRSPSRDLVEAMRLADPGGTMAREIERVRGELPGGAVLDLRAACPMTGPDCPDRCACTVNLWSWLRPRIVAGIGEALGDSFTCPRCGMTSHNPDDVREGYCGNCHDWTRPVGTLADPASPISRWVRGEPLFGAGGDHG